MDNAEIERAFTVLRALYDKQLTEYRRASYPEGQYRSWVRKGGVLRDNGPDVQIFTRSHLGFEMVDGDYRGAVSLAPSGNSYYSPTMNVYDLIGFSKDRFDRHGEDTGRNRYLDANLALQEMFERDPSYGITVGKDPYTHERGCIMFRFGKGSKEGIERLARSLGVDEDKTSARYR